MEVESAKIIATAIANGLDGVATSIFIGFLIQVLFRD